MNILAVIPARGGSKRFPRKNVQLLNGLPLVAHTIRAASSSRLITDTIFSTDDAEIQQVAREYGAFAPFLRPASLSGDAIRNSETMLHALGYMEAAGKYYDAVMLLQPTSPLRTSAHIDQSIEKFEASSAQTLASVKGPYQKRDINLKKVVDGRLENLIDQNQPYYIYNAAIYIARTEWLKQQRRFTSEDEVAFYMDEISSIDIDEELDLEIAKAALEFDRRKEYAKV